MQLYSYDNEDLVSVDTETLEVIGRGSYGTAYAYGNRVLKVSRSREEFEAARRLMEAPQWWSCKVYAAREVATQYYIVKECILLADLKEQCSHPGHFWGILYQKDGYKGIATRPVDFGRGHIARQKNIACETVKLSAVQIDFLAGLYSNSFQKRCFIWFMKAYWTAVAFGIDPCDLWCNIGIDQKGDFVFYDVMLYNPDKPADYDRR